MKYLLSEANQNTFVLFDCLHEGIKDTKFYEWVHGILRKEDRDDALILTGGEQWTQEKDPTE